MITVTHNSDNVRIPAILCQRLSMAIRQSNGIYTDDGRGKIKKRTF